MKHIIDSRLWDRLQPRERIHAELREHTELIAWAQQIVESRTTDFQDLIQRAKRGDTDAAREVARLWYRHRQKVPSAFRDVRSALKNIAADTPNSPGDIRKNVIAGIRRTLSRSLDKDWYTAASDNLIQLNHKTARSSYIAVSFYKSAVEDTIHILYTLRVNLPRGHHLHQEAYTDLLRQSALHKYGRVHSDLSLRAGYAHASLELNFGEIAPEGPARRKQTLRMVIQSHILIRKMAGLADRLLDTKAPS